MVTFKKGDSVFTIKDWDRKGTVSIRRMTVTGFGTKRITVVYTADGKPFKEMIWPHMLRHDIPSYCNVVLLPADTPDIEIRALQIAKDLLAFYTEELASDIKRRDELHEPRVIYPEQL